MAIDIVALRGLRLVARQTLAPRDAILYALGVGLGGDPTSRNQLQFLYEDGLQALPTMAVAVTYPPLLEAYVACGANPARVLHGEQRLRLHGPFPVDGELEGETLVTALVDKGPGRGLMVYNRTEIVDVVRNRRVATLDSCSVLMDEGGCGIAAEAPTIALQPVPGREPDIVREQAILPQAALIYRLSGDWNPLHVLPEVARATGHDRPLLHGRCTYGMAGCALLADMCVWDASRLATMAARFTAPVYPGETLRTEMWRVDHGVRFRTIVPARGVVALDRGFAEIA